jgi:hypothetical protein
MSEAFSVILKPLCYPEVYVNMCSFKKQNKTKQKKALGDKEGEELTQYRILWPTFWVNLKIFHYNRKIAINNLNLILSSLNSEENIFSQYTYTKSIIW